jgi:AraC-like DNA-binding protein
MSNFNIFPIDIPTAYSVVSACGVLTIFYLSFHGIRQYSIAEFYSNRQSEPVAENRTDSPRSKEKYKDSSLTEGEQESIYRDLLKLFEEQAIYCEPKLQLQDVAEALKVTPHALSQTINTLGGKPFYDFVNVYRVKYFQKLLQDPAKKRFTILALGLDSGFNSKASLNRVFKEHIGLSPSEYQKRHLRN